MNTPGTRVKKSWRNERQPISSSQHMESPRPWTQFPCLVVRSSRISRSFNMMHGPLRTLTCPILRRQVKILTMHERIIFLTNFAPKGYYPNA